MLYSLSFASLSRCELITLPHYISTVPLMRSYSPSQPHRRIASILRMMLRYSRCCPTRGKLENDLSELIGYHLYSLQNGYVITDDNKLCEALEVNRRVADAVQTVKSWGWDFEWRGRGLDRRCGGLRCKGIRGPRLGFHGLSKTRDAHFHTRPHSDATGSTGTSFFDYTIYNSHIQRPVTYICVRSSRIPWYAMLTFLLAFIRFLKP